LTPVVFVLGCPWSGASVISNALQKNAGFRMGPNGVMTPILVDFDKFLAERRRQEDAILASETAQSGTASDMDDAPRDYGMRAEIAMRLRRVFARKDRAPWLEKAHGVLALQCLPLLSQAFPEAKFIYMHRRLNETLAIHAGSSVSYAGITEIWVQCIDAWHAHKALVRGRMIEVDQRDLHFHPFSTADRLRLFLGLDSDATVKTALSLAHAAHDLSQDASPVRWEDIDMSPDDTWRIRQQCARAMKVYNYGYDENYHAADGLATMLARARDVSGFDTSGDGIQLKIPALQAEASGQIAIGQVRPGDRILAVVTCEERSGRRLFLRMRLTNGDVELDAKIFDLTASPGGEIDHVLPAAENLMLEVSLVAGRPEPREIAIRLRALRIVRSQGSASGTAAGVV
jgi:hypothetical protein